MTAVAALLIAQRAAFAGPAGGSVIEGSAGISQSGSVTNVNQSSNKAIINWQAFSIGTNETVNFNQPGSSSVVLNRVIGNETSVISGALNANGQVFIVNSAGVLFGKNAQVNVGGLVASTLDISNANFMAGNYTLSGNSTASVVNQGTIHAHGGGYVALLGNTVANDGVIAARLGTVAMAAGSQITLNFGGNSLLDVTIDRGALNALVENKRAIIANGGQVILTAKAADAVLSAQVNNSGIIQARSMAALTGGSSGKTRAAKTGSIKLLADGGTVNVTGKLDASAPKGGDGGFIETSGSKVKIADSAVITTKSTTGTSGTWLIDPDGFNIGGNNADITAATLSNELANGSIVIASTSGQGTDGNINVNEAMGWSSSSTLTLNATNNINISFAITALSGGLTLNAGGQISATAAVKVGTFTLASGTWQQVGNSLPDFSATDFRISGGTFLRALGGDGSSGSPYQIADVYGLQGMGSTSLLGNAFVLANDITNAAVTASWNSGAGFKPIGNSTTMFSGVFDGGNHTITGLTINNTTANVDIGLFGVAGPTAIIRNVKLANVNIHGGGDSATGSGVGALVGQNFANITNVSVDGSVSGIANNVGGLIGLNGAAVGSGPLSTGHNSITSSTSSATVSGKSSVGGLIGTDFNGDVINSSATGNVTATVTGIAFANAGGLIGQATNIAVIGSSAGVLGGPASTTVKGTSSTRNLGGLIGIITGGANEGKIENSSANVNVSGGSPLGGLVGTITPGAVQFTISGSSASGNVNGSSLSPISLGIGGLVGTINVGGGGGTDISNSSASGNVGFVAADGVTPGSVGSKAGGLVGIMTLGTIEHSQATGNVMAPGGYAGGLIGQASSVNISDSSAGIAPTNNMPDQTTVSGGSSSDYVGGLIGNWTGGTSQGSIRNSHADVNVSGGSGLGGLVGAINPGAGGVLVENSYATGKVSGAPDTTAISVAPGIGGLVGYVSANGNASITINNSWATGDVGFFLPDGVSAGPIGNFAGGLVGNIQSFGTIENSHASGSVTGSTTGSVVGGLLGSGNPTNPTTITNSYADGKFVKGNTTVGGLVGGNSGTITNSQSNVGEVSGTGDNIGGLVGTNNGSIVGSSSTSNVQGGPNSATGGLVGTNAGSIADSYAAGIVTGPSGKTGGIAGVNFNGSGNSNNTTSGSITNSWFNSDKNPGLLEANQLATRDTGIITGGGGLTTAQFADIQFYLNGTINQVLADRAAAAAAEAAAQAAAKAAAEAARAAAEAAARAAAQTAQAASRTADTIASNASAPTPPDPSLAIAGTQATVPPNAAKLDASLKTIKDNAEADDRREHRRVTAAAATQKQRGHRGGGGSDLGATIRSIDVDGQRFDLKDGGKKDAPGPKP